MKQIKFLNKKIDKYFVLLIATALFFSCADFDRDFEEERYLTVSHAEANASAGGTIGLQALDGAILSYFRDGEGSTDEFGLKAIDLGMDLRGNDMDMSRNTWFGAYNNYENII